MILSTYPLLHYFPLPSADFFIQATEEPDEVLISGPAKRLSRTGMWMSSVWSTCVLTDSAFSETQFGHAFSTANLSVSSGYVWNEREQVSL